MGDHVPFCQLLAPGLLKIQASQGFGNTYQVTYSLDKPETVC